MFEEFEGSFKEGFEEQIKSLRELRNTATVMLNKNKKNTTEFMNELKDIQERSEPFRLLCKNFEIDIRFKKSNVNNDLVAYYHHDNPGKYVEVMIKVLNENKIIY